MSLLSQAIGSWTWFLVIKDVSPDFFSSDSQRDWYFFGKTAALSFALDAPFTVQASSVYFLHDVRWLMDAAMKTCCVSCMCAAREQEFTCKFTCLLACNLSLAVPAAFGWRWGYTQDSDLTLKKKNNNNKRNIQCEELPEWDNMKAVKHAVQAENLEIPVSDAINGKTFFLLWLFLYSKVWHANWRSGLTCANCKAVEDFSQDKMPRGRNSCSTKCGCQVRCNSKWFMSGIFRGCSEGA